MGYTPYAAPANRPQDLNPNSFSGVGGGVMNNVVMTNYDIYAPAEWPLVMERHNMVPGFGAIIRAMGFGKGCSNPSTGHYEYPWQDNLLKVDTIETAAAGAGNPIVVNLTADSMYDSGVTVAGAARQASYPRIGQIIKTPSGVKAYVSDKTVSVTPHRITLTPTDQTVDLDAHVLAGGEYFFSDNAWGEGTGLPDGVTPRVMKYTNEFQITKESVATSGTELTNHTWFEPVDGQPGSFFLKAKKDTYERFEKSKDGILLWGETIDNINVASQVGHDVPVKGSEGLVSFAETNAGTKGYTTNAFAMSDFDEIADLFEDERLGTRDIMSLEGRRIYTERENVLQALLNGDASAYFTKKYMSKDIGAEWQPATDSDHAAMIGFTAVKKNGYTFNFYQLHDFNYIMGAGAEGYDWPHVAIMMPVGYTNDKKTGENRSLFGYEYKESNGYSRENVIDQIDGLGTGGSGTGNRAVNEYDIRKLGFLSEMAGHYACANSIVLVRPN
jgi:hypothetical protein